MIWPHASTKNPCPICGGTDWCSFGQKSILCRRAESERPHYDRGGSLDGWYHLDGDTGPVGRMPDKKPAEIKETPQFNPSIVFNGSTENIKLLASELNVSPESLHELNAGYFTRWSAWCFPMRGGAGEFVTIVVARERAISQAVLSGDDEALTRPPER